MGPYSDAGNELGSRVLRSIPGYVLGLGHNSIAVSPDGKTEYAVYHAWDTESFTSAVEVKWGIHAAGDRRSQWAELTD